MVKLRGYNFLNFKRNLILHIKSKSVSTDNQSNSYTMFQYLTLDPHSLYNISLNPNPLPSIELVL